MSGLQLLSSYLAEVVKEILRVVEDTVTEYREEAARTRRENQTLRSQLRDVLLLEARAEWPRAGPNPSFSFEQLSLSENSISVVTPPVRCSVPVSQKLPVCPEQQPPLQQEEKKEEQVSSTEQVERKQVISTDVDKNPHECSTEGSWTTAFSPASVRVKEEPEESLTDSETEEIGDQRGGTERGADAGEDGPQGGEEDGGEWRGEDVGEWKGDDDEQGREDDGGEWSEQEPEEPGLRLKPDPEPPSLTGTDRPQPPEPQVLSQPLPTQPLSSPHSTPRCPRCGDTFPTPVALLQHLYQQKKTHRCDFCCKSFSQSADLRRHHRTHTGERPHRCTFCARAFSQRGNLRRHLRIHTGERPYACPHCSRRFSDGDTLKKHLRTHGQVHTVPGLFLDQV